MVVVGGVVVAVVGVVAVVVVAGRGGHGQLVFLQEGELSTEFVMRFLEAGASGSQMLHLF